MSSNDDYTGGSKSGDKIVYWVAGGLVLVLVVIGLVSYRGATRDQAANDKADQFIAALQRAGVQRLPSQEQVARVLGDDGGSVCEDPNDALREATLNSIITNGAAGPGLRPIIFDQRLFRGQLAVIAIYCPEALPDFQDYVDDLKTGDVVRS
jgi:hypothetical protein